MTERRHCYGAEIGVEGQSKRWLARQRRRYERQMAPLGRWVAADLSRESQKAKKDGAELDRAA